MEILLAIFFFLFVVLVWLGVGGFLRGNLFFFFFGSSRKLKFEKSSIDSKSALYFSIYIICILIQLHARSMISSLK